MLVISRMRQESVMISGPEGGCLVTVLQARGKEASLLISHAAASKPGVLDSWTAQLVLDAAVQVGSTAEVALVDVREEKARLGINALKATAVHRLEVWEAIRQEGRRGPGGEESGPAGSRVPRPSSPIPPSLDVRLDQPPGADGSDEERAGATDIVEEAMV